MANAMPCEEKQFYIERNKQVAMDLYGDQLDDQRNIKGTKYYFDDCWRLRERSDAE